MISAADVDRDMRRYADWTVTCTKDRLPAHDIYRHLQGLNIICFVRDIACELKIVVACRSAAWFKSEAQYSDHINELE